jgi:hypothetical protein
VDKRNGASVAAGAFAVAGRDSAVRLASPPYYFNRRHRSHRNPGLQSLALSVNQSLPPYPTSPIAIRTIP